MIHADKTKQSEWAQEWCSCLQLWCSVVCIAKQFRPVVTSQSGISGSNPHAEQQKQVFALQTAHLLWTAWFGLFGFRFLVVTRSIPSANNSVFSPQTPHPSSGPFDMWSRQCFRKQSLHLITPTLKLWCTTKKNVKGESLKSGKRGLKRIFLPADTVETRWFPTLA